MADDPTLVDDDAAVDDGTAAQEAAEEEAERQAAAAAGMDPGTSTSQQTAESTPEDEALMDTGGGPEGGGAGSTEASGSTMSDEQVAEYEEMNFGAGDDDSMNVMTPDELKDSLETGEDQIEELGGSTSGGGEPSLGDFGGYGTSGESEPSVAQALEVDDSKDPFVIKNLETGFTSTTWQDADGNDAKNETYDPNTGTRTTTNYGENGDPVTRSTTTTDNDPSNDSWKRESWDEDGNKTTHESTYGSSERGETKTETTTWESADGKTKVQRWDTTTEGGELVGTGTAVTDENGATTTNSSTKDSEGNWKTNQEKTDADGNVIESSGDPLGGDDPVPGGQAESHVEELQEQMPEDAGPGNVDPNEYDDGEGDGDPTWDVQPDVVNPADEDEGGGPVGTPQDQSGWDTDPVDDDDVGMTLGPDDGGMELPTQQPTIDASDVVPDGDADDGGSGRPTVEVEEEYVVVGASGMPDRSGGSDGGDFGSGATFEAVASTDVFNDRASEEPASGDTESAEYGQAMAVEFTAQVAVPAEPDAASSRTVETDLDDAEIEIIANTLADDASTRRGEEDADPFD